MKPSSIYEFEVKTIDGAPQSLKEYQGQVLLIVNVASRCGYTKQYSGLEALYEKYKGKGFAVLGFPCNQFGAQEPGNEEEIKAFCELNYQVKFPLFSKIDVNGKETHPLYQYLKASQKGLLGTEAIKWNFTKFLINREGQPIKRLSPQDTPESLEPFIQEVL
jgi:glutathione peroxidase